MVEKKATNKGTERVGFIAAIISAITAFASIRTLKKYFEGKKNKK